MRWTCRAGTQLGDGRHADASVVARRTHCAACFLERILPVGRRHRDRGLARRPGWSRPSFDIAGVQVPIVASCWRIDLARADLPAEGCRCYMAAPHIPVCG